MVRTPGQRQAHRLAGGEDTRPAASTQTRWWCGHQASGKHTGSLVMWTIFRWGNYYWLIIIQGILLGGWIVVQMILLRHFYYLQFVFGGIGMLLVVIGYILRTKTKA